MGDHIALIAARGCRASVTLQLSEPNRQRWTLHLRLPARKPCYPRPSPRRAPAVNALRDTECPLGALDEGLPGLRSALLPGILV